jgi:hypothetical protein
VPRSHASFADFVAADPRRSASASAHVPLGDWWRAVEGSSYRAAWVPETGELYIVNHCGGRVRVIGAPLGAGELAARLDGWRNVVGRYASVEWLLAQSALRTSRADDAGMMSSAWMRPSSKRKRTFAFPLGQHALSPAT